ncbi:MAG: DUF6671 family protein [Bacillota bacterium]
MTAQPPEKMDGGSTYRGRKVALLTQHGKERVITPVLEAHLGCRVEHVSGYDTDRLGTFTREVPRAGTQLEAARTKARIGMELSGLSIGLASEGSFGPDPITGMLPWNVELLIWIDETLGIEVVGYASGKTNFSHRLTASWEEAKQFARDAGFPEHWLVMRPEGEEHPQIRKGIASWDELEKAFHWACSRATNGRAFLETDMRAHANPTRMEMIASAARDLAQKLRSYCPACGAPGFHAAERLAGLPCEGCGAPTRETRAEVHRCAQCGHQLIVEKNEAKTASAARCDYCNP